MSSAHTLPTRTVLADVLPGARVKDALLVVTGAALTGLAAQVSILTPLSPVPFTLQTLAVLVTGAALGSMRGLLYLMAGGAGLPWFAGHASGWGGPSFGYVIGFVFAAVVVGALAERRADRHVVSTVAMLALGSLIIYAIGATWLAAGPDLSAAKAFELGVLPFLATDALKIGLAALALPGAWKLVSR